MLCSSVLIYPQLFLDEWWRHEQYDISLSCTSAWVVHSSIFSTLTSACAFLFTIMHSIYFWLPVIPVQTNSLSYVTSVNFTCFRHICLFKHAYLSLDISLVVLVALSVTLSCHESINSIKTYHHHVTIDHTCYSHHYFHEGRCFSFGLLVDLSVCLYACSKSSEWICLKFLELYWAFGMRNIRFKKLLTYLFYLYFFILLCSLLFSYFTLFNIVK